MQNIKIIECPRDAMQGIHKFIPTDLKTEYLNLLLKVGFDTLDFGSFVSPKAIPQLRDTEEVLKDLQISKNKTKLLAIIANIRGAEKALEFEKISFLGYPFSISENFQQRNTGRSIDIAVKDLEVIINKAQFKKKEVVTYLSMGFGNPYKEPWSIEIVEKWTERIALLGCKIISLADTVGSANPDDIAFLFKTLIKNYPDIEFGAHFHASAFNWEEKIDAAFKNGCRRFDSALKGYGGCPMADDELVGNIATENLISYFQKNNIKTDLNSELLKDAIVKADEVFGDKHQA